MKSSILLAALMLASIPSFASIKINTESLKKICKASSIYGNFKGEAIVLSIYLDSEFTKKDPLVEAFPLYASATINAYINCKSKKVSWYYEAESTTEPATKTKLTKDHMQYNKRGKLVGIKIKNAKVSADLSNFSKNHGEKLVKASNLEIDLNFDRVFTEPGYEHEIPLSNASFTVKRDEFIDTLIPIGAQAANREELEQAIADSPFADMKEITKFGIGANAYVEIMPYIETKFMYDETEVGPVNDNEKGYSASEIISYLLRKANL